VKALLPEHEAQLLHYLKSTGRKVGYLVNFGAFPKLDWRRRVR
jgi:GxxExxY protein